MHLHEAQEQIPVGRDRAVPAVVHHVAERVELRSRRRSRRGEPAWRSGRRPLCKEDRRAGGRHLIRAERFFAEQRVDRTCGDGREELALRIGPEVLVAGLQQQRPRRDRGDQHVRIDGQLVSTRSP